MSDVLVRVAELRVGRLDDELVTIGLGSCVAIILHDAAARVGGLAHILLPSPALSRPTDGRPGKVPQTAVPELLSQMRALGARSDRVTARLVGGASMFASLNAPGTIQMGERNVVASRQVLAQHGLAITGEEVGGDYGRTVRLRTSDGKVEISSVLHGTSEL
jgi:chemotaxis protein CheD